MDNFPDQLLEAANVLHWLGKFRIANALTLTVRLLNLKGICTLEGFETWLAEQETDDLRAREEGNETIGSR